jgi:multicomponent Na+:H+ antiporter subunit D
MKLAMGLFGFLCIGLGVWPEPLYAILPYTVDYVPYTFGHVVEMLQLLLFSGLAFFLLLPLMKRTLTITLDVDWFYRRVFMAVARDAIAKAQAAYAEAWAATEARLERLLAGVFRHHGPHGILARAWPTGSMVLWAVALLAGCLIIYYR